MAGMLHDLKRAIETGDEELWSSLHSDDFVMTELWNKSHPPSNPMTRTKDDVAAIVGRAVKNGVVFHVENMLASDSRIAYTVTCIQPNGRAVVSNNNAEVRDGLIVSEVVVEAGEPD